MESIKQIDCFNINLWFWTLIGLWPGIHNPRTYSYYSKIFVTIFIIIYNSLFTINFYFVEENLHSVIEEMIFYFTEVACTSKVFTFLWLHKEILEILALLESDIFQPTTNTGLQIIKDAKKRNRLHWKIYAGICVTCNIAHVFIPVIAHIALSAPLELPVCSYSFLSKKCIERFNYFLYLYQSVGIHVTMWYNVNIDTFLLGVMVFAMAQLDILDEKLRKLTKDIEYESEEDFGIDNVNNTDKETRFISKLNQCIIHFDEVGKYCALIQRVFSITLFVQFSMSSYIICVCLFRFTLPTTWQYTSFLATYMTCMILQVMMPCWYGTQIIEKSSQLANAIYDCDWINRNQRFKSNMKFFVMRTSRPLYISGWKWFPLSLKTFSAIMNSAYSVFALLRHMQVRQ